jgi:hypothetical protein
MTCLRLLFAAAVTVLSSGAALAQAGETGATTAWRCGNSYSTQPCPGGTAVDVGDARSDTQRRQAEAVKQQDTRLAGTLAAERQARDRAVAGQRPATLGPTEADRARAQAAAERLQARQLAKDRKAKKKPRRPPQA